MTFLQNLTHSTNTEPHLRQGTKDNTVSRSNGSGGLSRAAAARAASTPNLYCHRQYRLQRNARGGAKQSGDVARKPKVEAGRPHSARQTPKRRPTIAARFRSRAQGDGSSSTATRPEAGQRKRATESRATPPYRSRISTAKPAPVAPPLTAGRHAPVPGGDSKPEPTGFASAQVTGDEMTGGVGAEFGPLLAA